MCSFEGPGGLVEVALREEEGLEGSRDAGGGCDGWRWPRPGDLGEGRSGQ